MDINATTWNVGAKKGHKHIISSSLSFEEAKSYIFQSPDRERINKKAVGVVIKLKNTARHELFEDNNLNSTKTIYHSYSSVPAYGIEEVSILGPYGAENIKHISDKIDKREASYEWVKGFDKRV